MPYYDRIAKRWHEATGFRGGAFKELLLNERILARIPTLQDAAILELGAGNGYFAAMMRDRLSGQTPRLHVVSDQSEKLLEIAERRFRIPGGEYLQLDVRAEFPFETGEFDLVLATTVGLRRALGECQRMLRPTGRLASTVLHPGFVASPAMSRRTRCSVDSDGVCTSTRLGTP